MFTQTTLECNENTAIAVIKKAWKPSTRLVGNDTNGRFCGTEELAAVLQYGDLDDMHEIVLGMYIAFGLKHNVITRDKRGGFTVNYRVR